jgi:hypothetical protein
MEWDGMGWGGGMESSSERGMTHGVGRGGRERGRKESFAVSSFPT